MLNIEKYKDIVLESLKPCKLKAGLYREGAKIVACKDVSCTDCKERLFKWLTEEYKEPVLDDAEKAYLSNIITPFRNKVDYVQLCSNGITCFVRICVKYYSYRNIVEYVNLPLFEKNRMYKKMEINKQYSLEELGLWLTM